MAAQELRLTYRRSRDLPDARRRLQRRARPLRVFRRPKLLRLARTLDAWAEELLAYLHHLRSVQRADRSDYLIKIKR